jgi:hypothetical protein
MVVEGVVKIGKAYPCKTEEGLEYRIDIDGKNYFLENYSSGFRELDNGEEVGCYMLNGSDPGIIIAIACDKDGHTGMDRSTFDKRVLYHMYREQRSKYNQLIINDKIRDQVDFVNSELLRKVSEKEVVKRPRLAQV